MGSQARGWSFVSTLSVFLFVFVVAIIATDAAATAASPGTSVSTSLCHSYPVVFRYVFVFFNKFMPI